MKSFVKVVNCFSKVSQFPGRCAQVGYENRRGGVAQVEGLVKRARTRSSALLPNRCKRDGASNGEYSFEKLKQKSWRDTNNHNVLCLTSLLTAIRSGPLVHFFYFQGGCPLFTRCYTFPNRINDSSDYYSIWPDNKSQGKPPGKHWVTVPI